MFGGILPPSGGGGVSDADVTAAVNAAVTTLVDGAPGALDKLNELAAAMGDDADFVGTMTAALAGKEPTQTAASQVEMETGTEAAIRSMSPLRIKQAIDALGGGGGGGDALVADPLSQFSATTSAQLAGVISDETGSGALVFATSPTFVTPVLGTPASGTLTNCTGLPQAGVVGLTASDSPQFAAINLGHATDTTIARVSAGVVSIEGVNIVTTSATQTLTNKKLTPRVQSIASSSTVTPNADNDDCVDVTAQAVALTIANPSGTPVNFQPLKVRIKDNGTARAITWGANYAAGGSSLPSTTVLGKIATIGFLYNTANGLNKWQCVAVSQEA